MALRRSANRKHAWSPDFSRAMTTHTRPNFAASPLAQSDAAAKAQPAQPPATLAALVIDTAVRLGITHWVISPGSRSAPLTAALAQRTDISPLVVYDERSAGYIALGLAQQLRLPVGLVCTSGTAALNYGPAIAEAFYQSLPLVAITADRPPEWIDQQDNQAIHQMGIYGAHVRASFNLPVNDDHPDTHWHALRTVVDALQAATSLPPGPVHINAPLREPLYTTPPQRIIRPPHVAQAAQVHTVLAEQEVQGLLVALQTAARILIAGGPHPPDAPLIAALTALGNDSRVAVIGDVTANLHTVPSMHRHWEAALGTRDNATLDALQPELVISFGGAVTSRGLKTLLRNRPPSAFWRVGPGMPAPDTYKANTRVLPVTPANFFTSLAAAVKDRSASTAGYQQSWRNLADKAASTLDAELDSQPFGEFAAMRTLLRHLPQGAMVQIGNSMPIRYANLLGVDAPNLPGGVFANRGTSGIDGCVSTAVGAALANPKVLTLLFVGDLAFFYDRNGLWHGHLPANLRIVLLNNHGGGIFDVIEGPDTLPATTRRDYFLTPQPLTARRTAEDFGLRYTRVADHAALNAALVGFLAKRDTPALLEIETEMATNSATWRAVRARLAACTLA